MAESVVAWLESMNLSPELAIFIVSLLPVLELRGGLIAAKLLGLAWQPALLICFLGNMLPIPFILLFIRKVFDLLKRWDPMAKLVEKFERRAAKKSAQAEKKSFWGKLIFLYILVAIPLPGTGAWTGALVAAFMDMRMKYALPTIALGVLTAGFIVLALAYLFPSVFGY